MTPVVWVNRNGRYYASHDISHTLSGTTYPLYPHVRRLPAGGYFACVSFTGLDNGLSDTWFRTLQEAQGYIETALNLGLESLNA